MIDADLDLDYVFDKKQYKPEKYIKIRVCSQNNWGEIDWKTGKRIEHNGMPKVISEDDIQESFSAIILYIQGGGFIGGSTSGARPLTYFYTKHMRYPIFSVDYRQSPDYKFP